MLEDFREQVEETPFFEEEDPFDYVEEEQSRPSGQFLGMTPVQRFVIAVMVLMMTCTLGAFFLLVTEKVVPPFL